MSYNLEFADMYDWFYADKDYLHEASHIDKWFRQLGHSNSFSLLEIACGTGNHSFPLEKLGYEMTSFDYSQDMINKARQKAIAFKSSIQFSVEDMRNMPDYKNRFDGAICLFDSIGYALTNDAISSTLSGIRRNLKKNALFIFEFWHAAAMIKYYEEHRVKTIISPNGDKIKRISDTEISYSNQSCCVKYTISKTDNTGTVSLYTEIHNNRFFLVQEMNLFLKGSGFLPLKYFDGFSDIENITENSWHIVAIARSV